MNIKLLKRIRDVILANPQHFNMGDWFRDRHDLAANQFQIVERNGGTAKNLITPWKEDCGTTACIAGWACILSNADMHGTNARLKAQELLGLTPTEADSLFFTSYWPSQFHRKVANNPQTAAERIDYFIATDGRDY